MEEFSSPVTQLSQVQEGEESPPSSSFSLVELEGHGDPLPQLNKPLLSGSYPYVSFASFAHIRFYQGEISLFQLLNLKHAS